MLPCTGLIPCDSTMYSVSGKGITLRISVYARATKRRHVGRDNCLINKTEPTKLTRPKLAGIRTRIIGLVSCEHCPVLEEKERKTRLGNTLAKCIGSQTCFFFTL